MELGLKRMIRDKLGHRFLNMSCPELNKLRNQPESGVTKAESSVWLIQGEVCAKMLTLVGCRTTAGHHL
jgi:hypothetical protein